ncbi:hypothetical protein [Okeania sp. SIO2B3]|uniref:hypothetical protein n=1 Tax=Okeania sp. SIO2B3 TaxID=2607784 RepID=UPI0013BF0E6D|nr:hypothetical protein [Okeania sp. SIO2B3]NET45686.1 hypothetical protein [Okeania sp. SIO2B3]
MNTIVMKYSRRKKKEGRRKKEERKVLCCLSFKLLNFPNPCFDCYNFTFRVNVRLFVN